MTLKDFLEHFKTEHRLEVTMINQELVTIYSDFLSPAKIKERMEMRFQFKKNEFIFSPFS